jgi:hypothetical protein
MELGGEVREQRQRAKEVTISCLTITTLDID